MLSCQLNGPPRALASRRPPAPLVAWSREGSWPRFPSGGGRRTCDKRIGGLMHDAPALRLAPGDVRDPAFPGDLRPPGVTALHPLQRHDAPHVLSRVLGEDVVGRVAALTVLARRPVQA